ncbi:MAG: MOSC domain-containing protein [Gemmatimonadaceae bacterium]
MLIEHSSARDASDARVISVNVGMVREVEWNGELVRTGIWKEPVTSGRVRVHGVNLDGDDQADREAHGGRDKAVYAYSVEDYQYWRATDDVATHAGLFGENLTVSNIDLMACVVGERWAVGSTVLEVAQPRLPCFKLGIRMNDSSFPKRFQSVGRLGAYLRIIEEGDVAVGDAVRVSARPEHDVTLAVMLRALRDRSSAHALLMAPELPRFWRRVAAGEIIAD